MKIENQTTFRSLPFRQIVSRLGNRLGRSTPLELRIDICCDSKRCNHGTYLGAQWTTTSSTYAEKKRGISVIEVLYLWFPQKHDQITSRDVAYALDCSMKGEGILSPVRIQDRVALVRRLSMGGSIPSQRDGTSETPAEKGSAYPTAVAAAPARQN